MTCADLRGCNSSPLLELEDGRKPVFFLKVQIKATTNWPHTDTRVKYQQADAATFSSVNTTQFESRKHSHFATSSGSIVF